MRIGSIGGEVAPIAATTPGAAPAASFADELGHAVKSLDAVQTDADVESTKLAMGAGNLHETALALEKADIAMRVAVKVRNKAIEAYQELMRMQV